MRSPIESWCNRPQGVFSGPSTAFRKSGAFGFDYLSDIGDYEIREREAERLAERIDLDEIESTLSPLALADEGLGLVEFRRDLDLCETGPFPGSYQASEEHAIFLSEDRLLHGDVENKADLGIVEIPLLTTRGRDHNLTRGRVRIIKIRTPDDFNGGSTAMNDARGNEAGDFVFSVHSRVSVGGAKPPCIRTSDRPDSFFGFFENEDGEWMIFEYDTLKRKGQVFIQDKGAAPYPIIDGVVHGLNLTEFEAAWVKICWAAATRSPRRDLASA